MILQDYAIRANALKTKILLLFHFVIIVSDNTTTSSVTITCYVPAIENGMEFDRPAGKPNSLSQSTLSDNHKIITE